MTSVVSATPSFDIEHFVGEATWKDILVELVHKNQLNPWDIDIIDIVGKYVEVVKGLKVMDLRVPANIILAASILLRLKSDMLELRDEALEELTPEEGSGRPYVSVDPLSVRLRLPPRRRVTLPELISALEEAMKLREFKAARLADAGAQFPLTLSRVDAEADIEALFVLLTQHVDSSRMLTFSSLFSLSQKPDALLDVFIPLLFLANKNRIVLLQEDFFGEIVVALT
jgi:segregation and condensation protein A